MQVTISGHHVDVTPALHSYVEDKLARLKRHYERITDVQVILSVVKLTQKAEATVQVSGKALHADAEDHDMYAAIDAMADKLDRQLKKYKEKNTDHHRDQSPT
jgi:putative sigma-54 modulation protein